MRPSSYFSAELTNRSEFEYSSFEVTFLGLEDLFTLKAEPECSIHLKFKFIEKICLYCNVVNWNHK